MKNLQKVYEERVISKYDKRKRFNSFYKCPFCFTLMAVS